MLELEMMKQRLIFVTGIGTEVGKTVVSAILAEALQADYWKPIQAGDLDQSDTLTVSRLITNGRTTCHPEAYRLATPMSPHAAAAIDKVVIEIDKMKLPMTDNHLIIEGAGGLMVPLNQKELIIDLIAHLGVETVLVSHNYLGSINHTLLSIEALSQRRIPITGVIFNGVPNRSTETIILQRSGLKQLGRVETEPLINRDVVRRYARQFRQGFESRD